MSCHGWGYGGSREGPDVNPAIGVWGTAPQISDPGHVGSVGDGVRALQGKEQSHREGPALFCLGPLFFIYEMRF